MNTQRLVHNLDLHTYRVQYYTPEMHILPDMLRTAHFVLVRIAPSQSFPDDVPTVEFADRLDNIGFEKQLKFSVISPKFRRIDVISDTRIFGCLLASDGLSEVGTYDFADPCAGFRIINPTQYARLMLTEKGIRLLESLKHDYQALQIYNPQLAEICVV